MGEIESMEDYKGEYTGNTATNGPGYTVTITASPAVQKELQRLEDLKASLKAIDLIVRPVTFWRNAWSWPWAYIAGFISGILAAISWVSGWHWTIILAIYLLWPAGVWLDWQLQKRGISKASEQKG